MILRCALACVALLLAGCGSSSGAGNVAAPAAPAAPVATAVAPAGQDWTQVVSQTPDGGYVMGNPEAPIKLVEYGSRTCPTCGAFGQTGMRPLEDTYVKSGKVSYEFRDFMVHAPDLGVALLGRCAGAQPFFPILEQMYLEQPTFLPKLENAQSFQQGIANETPTEQATAWVDYLGYVDFVKQRGVPEAQARACLTNPAMIKAVTDLTQTAMSDKNVTGTPTFFLNGDQLQNMVTWPQIETALKAAGA